MTEQREIKVGDVLFCRLINRYNPIECHPCVTKVGRTWVYLSNGHRMYKETFVLDGNGYQSPGRCYWSREQYTEALRAEMISKAIRHYLPYKVGGDKLTISELRAIANLLEIDENNLDVG